MRQKSTALLPLALAAMCLSTGYAWADEVKDLEEELALTIEDATPSKAGSVQFNGGMRYQRMRPQPGEGRNEWQFTPRLQFGLTQDFQASVSTPYRIGDAPGTSQGEFRLEGLYRLNRETESMPSFAVDAGVEQPYGANRGGTEALVKGIMTKSLGTAPENARRAQLHVNVVARHNFNPDPLERRDRYLAGAALSHQVSERWLVAGSLFREQQREASQTLNMGELGARWKLSDKVILSGALGHGFSGPVRNRFLVGMQRSLD
ncbi:MAG: hypothetical protein JWP36_39 [Paucimonas sp.]|nr:hypothetical protein [Paucimonas sp.]